MKDILSHVEKWQIRGEAIAVATVVKTWGSSPRAPGAKMVLTHSGEMAGSVSGGCVESAVIQEAQSVLQHHTPKLLHFGVADDTAWAVGLACGGTIDIFVEQLTPTIFAAQKKLISAAQNFVTATVISGPKTLLGAKAVIAPGETVGTLPDTPLSRQIRTDAETLLTQKSAVKTYSLPDTQTNVEVFFDVHRPPPRLIIVGGVHIAVELIDFARKLGFTTYLVDPRTAFATPERFPHADHIIHRWPDEALQAIGLNSETYVVVVTHDPKLDDPALKVALSAHPRYVGALGSKKTHAKRIERLLADGLSPEALARLHAPIGLKLGGRTPAEIAISIIAQIVAVQNGVDAHA